MNLPGTAGFQFLRLTPLVLSSSVRLPIRVSGGRGADGYAWTQEEIGARKPGQRGRTNQTSWKRFPSGRIPGRKNHTERKKNSPAEGPKLNLVQAGVAESSEKTPEHA